MKKLLRASLLLFVTLFVFNACTEDDDSDDFVIDYTSLPTECKTFVTTHFGADPLVSQVKERYVAEADGTYYMVYLNGGYEIDFKKNGEWVSVENETSGLAQSVVEKLLKPAALAYLSEHHASIKVEEIDNLGADKRKVELTNDVVIIFDAEGKPF